MEKVNEAKERKCQTNESATKLAIFDFDDTIIIHSLELYREAFVNCLLEFFANGENKESKLYQEVKTESQKFFDEEKKKREHSTRNMEKIVGQILLSKGFETFFKMHVREDSFQKKLNKLNKLNINNWKDIIQRIKDETFYYYYYKKLCKRGISDEMKQILDELKSRNIPIFIISKAEHAYIDYILENIKIKEEIKERDERKLSSYFSIVCGKDKLGTIHEEEILTASYDNFSKKPNGKVIFNSIYCYNYLHPESKIGYNDKMLFVGDSIFYDRACVINYNARQFRDNGVLIKKADDNCEFIWISTGIEAVKAVLFAREEYFTRVGNHKELRTAIQRKIAIEAKEIVQNGGRVSELTHPKPSLIVTPVLVKPTSTSTLTPTPTPTLKKTISCINSIYQMSGA